MLEIFLIPLDYFTAIGQAVHTQTRKDTMGLLEHYRLIGWGDIEATITASLFAGINVCFVGNHGIGKSFSVRSLIAGIMGLERPAGDEINFINCPLADKSSTFGMLDVSALQKGQYRRIPHAKSVLSCEVLVLDEINRGGAITNDLMELACSRSLGGEKLTKLKYVLASLNPPNLYRTQYFDWAAASRFGYAKPPNTEDLLRSNYDEYRRMLRVGIADGRGDDIRLPDTLYKVWCSARQMVVSPAAIEGVEVFVEELAKKIVSVENSGIIWEGRQSIALCRVLLAYHKLSAAASLLGVEYGSGSQTTDVMNITLSTFPEYFGVVNTTKWLPAVTDMIEKHVEAAFRLGDASIRTDFTPEQAVKRLAVAHRDGEGIELAASVLMGACVGSSKDGLRAAGSLLLRAMESKKIPREMFDFSAEILSAAYTGQHHDLPFTSGGLVRLNKTLFGKETAS